jgi:ACS family tartrate transporter-like MFS transporter
MTSGLVRLIGGCTVYRLGRHRISLASAFLTLGTASSFIELVGACYYAFYPVFWSVPSAFLSGSAAASIGLTNSLGNLGGFAGPLMMARTGSFHAGLLYLKESLCLSGLLMLVVGEGPSPLRRR